MHTTFTSSLALIMVHSLSFGAPLAQPDAVISELVSSEELIQTLTPELKKISASVKNLALPDHRSQHLFAGQLIANDLGPWQKDKSSPALSLTSGHWPLVPTTSTPKALWQELFSKVSSFQDISLGVIQGKWLPDRRFSTTLQLSARGHTASHDLIGIKGTLALVWQAAPEQTPPWQITSCQVQTLTSISSPHAFFEDVIPSAIPSPIARQRATTSLHDIWLAKFLSGEGIPFPYGKKYLSYFQELESGGQHPGVAVVDLDRDGWDDIYVMPRWGKNQFWLNLRNGTFREVAPLLGLDLDGMCTSAIFADFDNDGDADLFVGRSLKPSAYLINEGGRFTESTASHLAAPLPTMVSSIAAADYNRDGLLDLYLSTYYLPGSTIPEEVWTKDLLDPADLAEWHQRRAKDHPMFSRTGPPNALLMNAGDGKFVKAPENDALALWRCSFQSSWSDFDNDRDPDLIVTNDYAPDDIFRNEGPDENGHIQFTKVTEALTGDHLQGFGMGTSFGDYDNDRQLDLYVSYMFSKAGSRITDQLPGLENRMRQAARGNKLFRNEDGKFKLVSGFKPPALQVSKTGWSWGGQFADLDNDQFIDLYVPNGFYSAPKAIASEVDL